MQQKEKSLLENTELCEVKENEMIVTDEEINDFLRMLVVDDDEDDDEDDDVDEDVDEDEDVDDDDDEDEDVDEDVDDDEDDGEDVDEDVDFGEAMAERFEESLAFLDDMVGMEHVKQKLLRLGRYALWKRRMEDEGIDTSIFPQPNLTFMFLGAPGTGKTTVAQQMGRILRSIGLIRWGLVYEYRRENLVGQNYGCEEENTRAALNESDGAVFFLDEAYQCFKQGTDKRDPGYHILETMMQEFGKPGRCIIMAGYKNEMLELFQVNPGFRSRIPDENIIEFTGPSEQMLVDVATNAFRKMSLDVTQDADAMLRHHIHAMWVNKDQDFGNARVIRQLAESVVINHANRIMTTTQGDDFTINVCDMQQSLSSQHVKTPTRTRIGFA